MPDYNVMVQNIEDNASNISITGLVNGRQVAAVVPQARKPTKGGRATQDNFYAGALVDAYLAMPPIVPGAASIKVSR